MDKPTDSERLATSLTLVWDRAFDAGFLPPLQEDIFEAANEAGVPLWIVAWRIDPRCAQLRVDNRNQGGLVDTRVVVTLEPEGALRPGLHVEVGWSVTAAQDPGVALSMAEQHRAAALLGCRIQELLQGFDAWKHARLGPALQELEQRQEQDWKRIRARLGVGEG